MRRSDTTAFTLVMLLAHLAEQPDLQARLWAEIEACPDNTPFLDACIGEALRLHPSVASGTPRTSPPEGLVLADGTRIPSGVNVILPLYALQRDPDRFDEPDHFIPDRVSSPFIPPIHSLLIHRSFIGCPCIPLIRFPFAAHSSPAFTSFTAHSLPNNSSYLPPIHCPRLPIHVIHQYLPFTAYSPPIRPPIRPSHSPLIPHVTAHSISVCETRG